MVRREQSVGRSQPFFYSVGDEEEEDADEDDEANRRVSARQVIAFRKIVDELAEPAEVDQELDADDVDQREDHAETHPDENGRQGSRKVYFPEQLHFVELEAAPDI